MALPPRWITKLETRFAQLGDSHLIEGRVVDAETGTPLAPSAATITVTRRGGGALDSPVSGASMTVSNEWLRHTLSANFVAAPERFIKAAISVTIGGVAYGLTHFLDVCRVAPVMVADVSEVAIGSPGLEYLGTQEDPSAQEVHREAWEVVVEWLRSVAGYPDLLLDHTLLKMGHIHKSRELLYSRSATGKDHPFAHQAEMHRRRFEEWAKATALTLDRDRSGNIDPDEGPRSVAVVTIGRREADYQPGSW